jgi:hypothetical protein
VFQLECRTVPAGRVGRFEDMWDSLGDATAHVNLVADPTPTPPASATIIYMLEGDAALQHSEQASEAATPLPSRGAALSGGSSAGGLPMVARIAEAASEQKEARRREAAAKAELAAQKDVGTSLESQRDELIAESKEGSSRPSVRLSVAIFAMLTAYALGMLLARGWPRVPATVA